MTQPAKEDLIHQETALLDAGIALQSEGLKLLLAEMHALAALMSGVDASAQPASPGDAAEVDAAVEAGFDNMPV